VAGYPEYLKSEIYASQTKQAFACSLAVQLNSTPAKIFVTKQARSHACLKRLPHGKEFD